MLKLTGLLLLAAGAIFRGTSTLEAADADYPRLQMASTSLATQTALMDPSAQMALMEVDLNGPELLFDDATSTQEPRCSVFQGTITQCTSWGTNFCSAHSSGTVECSTNQALCSAFKEISGITCTSFNGGVCSASDNGECSGFSGGQCSAISGGHCSVLSGYGGTCTSQSGVGCSLYTSPGTCSTRHGDGSVTGPDAGGSCKG